MIDTRLLQILVDMWRERAAASGGSARRNFNRAADELEIAIALAVCGQERD